MEHEGYAVRIFPHVDLIPEAIPLKFLLDMASSYVTTRVAWWMKMGVAGLRLDPRGISATRGDLNITLRDYLSNIKASMGD